MSLVTVLEAVIIRLTPHLQLDENFHDPNSDNNYFDENTVSHNLTPNDIKGLQIKERLQGYGDKIDGVTDETGKPLKFTINQTMMRIDLLKSVSSMIPFVHQFGNQSFADY